jgi:phytanoyl-CoA hydroxylase
MGGLTEEQKKCWEENGFVLLDNIFTNEEMEEMSEAYDDVFDLKKKQTYDMEAAWTGEWRKEEKNKTVLSIHNLQCHHQVFTKTITNKKLVDAVADCVGSPNVLLHHTKAHIKPPEKGTAYPAHQDYHYFPYEKHSMVAAFVHMDDSDRENGGLYVFPGSHKNGPLKDVSPDPDFHYMEPSLFPAEKGYTVNAKKGQVLIFSYLTVHASYPNTSSRTRRMLLIQMMAAEDKPTQSVHMSPCQGMVLRGKNIERNADMSKRHEA